MDETGGQIAIFGRLGSRPFTMKEMQKLYLDSNGNPWTVTDEIRTQDLVTTPQRRRPPGQQADTPPARRASLGNPAQ